MTMSHGRGSAEIFQFPARGRYAVSGGRDELRPAASVASSRMATIAFGSSWYHEEAIREAEQARKN